ncbi:hypothetical protein [Paenibacillus silvisoli]|uniref:hypothetical protein n=1 Tax=Paenibacillus silvisoli TaxID=3110539 RepID=UPI00280529D4|nr:hypothetical protein [Paenibacillus silvisoli]
MDTRTATVMDGFRYDDMRSNLSIMNAYGACFKYLGRAHQWTSWLYGAVAIPFLFRVDDVNRAPVLYELPYERIVSLLNNLGVRVEGISAIAEQGGALEQLREQAWDAARKAIDAGYPCFSRGIYFNAGESSIVSGYDEERQSYVTGCWHGTQLVSKGSFGDVSGGLVDLHWLMPDGQPEDDRRTVREALQLAVEFADGRLTGPRTRVGSAAYDHWIGELRKGSVDGWFFAYNTHEWDTCRTHGLRFLQEATRRFGSKAPRSLDGAIMRFGKLQKKIHEVYELFPWEQPRGLIEDTERRLEAASLLEEAKAHDAAAMDAFRILIQELA